MGSGDPTDRTCTVYRYTPIPHYVYTGIGAHACLFRAYVCIGAPTGIPQYSIPSHIAFPIAIAVLLLQHAMHGMDGIYTYRSSYGLLDGIVARHYYAILHVASTCRGMNGRSYVSYVYQVGAPKCARCRYTNLAAMY